MWVELLQLASWVQVYLGGLDGSKTCCLVGWAGLDRIDHWVIAGGHNATCKGCQNNMQNNNKCRLIYRARQHNVYGYINNSRANADIKILPLEV